MQEPIEHWLNVMSDVDRNDNHDQVERMQRARQLFATLSADECGEVLSEIHRRHSVGEWNDSTVNQSLYDLVLGSSTKVERTTANSCEASTALAAKVVELYLLWPDTDIQRHLLLSYLASRVDEPCWRAFTDLIVESPPGDVHHVIEAFVPFWKCKHGPYKVLFPQLLDAVQHPQVAAVVLDFSNFLSRERKLAEHPGWVRRAQLTALLGQLVERLEKFEDDSARSGVADLDTAKAVTETIALAVALCHAMALMNHTDAIGKLHRMLALRHRRLRVEAAYALAKLQDTAGIENLKEMASESVVRLRANAYAAELGVLDEIAAEYRSPQAVAEAHMVVHLAEPSQFGLPPTSCELVDDRELYWPGFDEPVRCFLFQFRYAFAHGELVNTGIVGPVTLCVSSDLTDLPVPDVYAVFAGLGIEHDDVRMWNVDHEDPHQQIEITKCSRFLEQKGCTQIRPAFFASFFGDSCFVASVECHGERGTMVVDHTDAHWIAAGNLQRPIDAKTAYGMYVGRAVLEHFNGSL